MGLGEDTAEAMRRLELGGSDLVQGTVTAIDWPNKLATVNVSGGAIPMPMLWQAPLVGNKVWVAYLGKQPLCLGPVARGSRGTVQGTPSGGYAVVLADDGVSYTVPYLGSAPSNGQSVVILWGPGGVVPAGVLSAAPLGTVPVVPPVAPQVEKQFVFYASDSGNWYNNSSYANGLDPWSSDSNDGVFFYGTVIADSIPDDATFVPGSLYIFLAEFYNQFPGSYATFGRHALAGKSGNPGMSSEMTIPNLYPNGGWVQLPDSWEASLRLGTSRGFGFNGGGFHKYRRAGVSNSGTFVGSWRV